MFEWASRGRPLSLSTSERSRLLVLGLPSFGLALAIAAVSTYLPVLAHQQRASTVAIGTIIGGVAVIDLAGALGSGWLGDRFGRARVVEAGLWVYGLCLLAPAIKTTPATLIPAVLLVALCGGMLMSLPYSLLMPLMPAGEHGALTGLYSVSRGLGVMLGPLLAGLAISLARPLFDSTDGYAAAWWVAALAALLSLVPLRRLRRERTTNARGVSLRPVPGPPRCGRGG